MTYAMHPYTLHRPGTVAEAVALAAAHPGAKYLAGGTDLVVNMRRRIAEPEHVIALGGIAALRGIANEGGALVIGAGTTLAEIAADEAVRRQVPFLAEAAGLVAGPTIRQMATLGGNLTLDTRCRYYNQSFFWRQANDFCLKKDGTVCHVAPGGSFCWAAFSGDTPPVLLLLGAEIEIAGPAAASTQQAAAGTQQIATRTQPLAALYGKDGRWSLEAEIAHHAPGGLKPGELIVRVKVPLPAEGSQGVYEKVRVRDSIDYPLVGLAMQVRWRNAKPGVMDEVKLALTAVNPRPEIVPGTEAFAGKVLNAETVEALAKLAYRTGKPMRTTVSDHNYRRAMITSLVEKAAMRLVPDLRDVLLRKQRWA